MKAIPYGSTTEFARRPKARPAQSAHRVAICMLLSFSFSECAASNESDDGNEDSSKIKTTLPTTYLDLRINYTTLPANTLSIGFSGPSVLATLPGLSSPSSRSVAVDAPLTVDLNDRLSLYGGVTASVSQTDTTSWTSFAISSWNIGFQADIYKQDGGSIPTVTVQSTITRSVPDSPLATMSLNIIVESSYALNKDETKGLLAGAQYTRVAVDTALATVNPNLIGYVGAYYQWDNNWKLSGRAGVQAFGGAQLLNLTPIQAFTQPVVRVDWDRMDDNDNRLFGISTQIAWTPKPSYQLILRMPLYAVRN